MLKHGKLLTWFLPLLLAAALLTACENDLNKVQQLSAQESNKPVDTNKVVDVIYSDSAHVKAHMLTPLLLHYNYKTNPYYEMPKSIKITFYDNKRNPTGVLTADYAITSNNDKIITMRRNVVLTSTAGDTFRSELLIWDQNKKIIYTNQRWEWHKTDGTDLNGTYFKTDENFTSYETSGANGDIQTNGALKP